ncbi:RCAS1-like protein [Mya arenaria]|uniref:RCAS1-like protein n=1 Tax=Mya arenaria TaxID=6604 RepID=A0ABY7F2T6_MYAAR|nr:receptor-binding cancer antigen expressed on SiSo cells-like [Mya arenaria]XP_052762540.1 receptor-binding cancer antigen expressed on SiSo cells-like [Mya arenaria]WAR16503.1 RCAS1-like protein [Mya arenaria]
MIKVVWNVVKKIFSVIFLLLSPLKRLWCRRKRRTSDTILPLTNHYPSVENLNANYSALNGSSQGGEDLTAWDQWDDQQQQQYNERVRSVEEYRQRQLLQQQQSQEEMPEPDYFQDMIPDYKKQKKVLIKKREENSVNTGSISSKLAMSTDVPLMQSSELASWEEQDNAWDEDNDTELGWEADNVIREKRKQDRQQRQLENQKRNREREQQRQAKSHSNLAAVRLS